MIKFIRQIKLLPLISLKDFEFKKIPMSNLHKNSVKTSKNLKNQKSKIPSTFKSIRTFLNINILLIYTIDAMAGCHKATPMV